MPSRHLGCSAQVIFSGLRLTASAFGPSLFSAVAVASFAFALPSFVASEPGFFAGPAVAAPLLSLPRSGPGLPASSDFAASPTPALIGFFSTSPVAFLGRG